MTIKLEGHVELMSTSSQSGKAILYACIIIRHVCTYTALVYLRQLCPIGILMHCQKPRHLHDSKDIAISYKPN